MVKSSMLNVEIVSNPNQYKYCGEWYCIGGKWMQEQDAKIWVARNISDVKPSTISNCLELIKMNKVEFGSLWNLFEDATPYKWNGEEPYLFSFYNGYMKTLLMNVVASVLKGRCLYTYFLSDHVSCGKSFIIKAIKSAFTERFSYTKQLDAICTPFGLSGLASKLFLYCDDLGSGGVDKKTSGIFKQLCSGGEIEINQKHKQQEVVNLELNMMFALNNELDIDWFDCGLLKRVIKIYFDKTHVIPPMDDMTYQMVNQRLVDDAPNLLAWARQFEINEQVLLDARGMTVAREHRAHTPYLQKSYLHFVQGTGKVIGENKFNKWKDYMESTYKTKIIKEPQWTVQEELPF